MARAYQNIFLSAETTPSINSGDIPRSYSHSPDDSSESGSLSGGGGGSYGAPSPPVHEGQHANYSPQVPAGDTPFVPRRNNIPQSQYQPSAARGFIFPPEPHHTVGSQSYPPGYVTGQYPEFNQSGLGGAYAPRQGYATGFTPESASRRGLEHENSWETPGNAARHYRAHLTFPPGGMRYQQQPDDASAFNNHASHPSPVESSSSGYSQEPSPIGLHPSEFDSQSQYPDAEEYLRNQLNITPPTPVNLWALPEPPNGQKPQQPLPVLIKLAIHGAPRRKLTLQGIYTELGKRFEWCRVHRSETAWKGSIRHQLSLNKVFKHSPRPITEPGKGRYWEIDISEGEGYKRERKRKNKNKKRVMRNIKEVSGNDGEASLPSEAVTLARQESTTVGQPRPTRRTSPYAQAGQLSSPATRSPIGGPYSPLDVPQAHAGFGSQGFAPSSYRQPSFGQSSLVPQQPVFGLSLAPSPQGHPEPISRAASYPPAHGFSPSPQNYAATGSIHPSPAPVMGANAGYPDVAAQQQQQPEYDNQNQNMYPQQGSKEYDMDVEYEGNASEGSRRV